MHNRYIKDNLNQNDHLSNLLKSIPTKLYSYNNPTNDEIKNNIEIINQIKRGTKQYTNIDFERKNQEDLIDYNKVREKSKLGPKRA